MNNKLKEMKLYFKHIKENGINIADYNILIFVFYGILFDALNNMFRPFSIKFVQRIGGSDIHISLLNSLPGLVGVFVVLPGALLVQRITNKKKVTAIFFGISRAFILSLALVPVLPSHMQPYAFVILLAIMNFPDAISQTSFQSYIGKIIVPGKRAMAIAMRNKYGNLSVLVVTLATGLIINYAAQTDEQKIVAYQIFFVVAFLIAIFEIIVFYKFKESRVEAVEEKINFKEALSEVMKNKKFIKYTTSILFFYFAWYMGWPLGSMVLVNKLNGGEMAFAFSTIITVAIFVLTSTRWGRYVEQYGYVKIIMIAASGMGVTIFLTPLMPNIYMYLVNAATVSFFLSGLNIALFSGLLEATPDKNKVVYIGVFNTFTNIELAIAPLLSFYIASKFGYVALGAIIGVLRVVAALIMLFSYRNNLKKL